MGNPAPPSRQNFEEGSRRKSPRTKGTTSEKEEGKKETEAAHWEARPPGGPQHSGKKRFQKLAFPKNQIRSTGLPRPPLIPECWKRSLDRPTRLGATGSPHFGQSSASKLPSEKSPPQNLEVKTLSRKLRPKIAQAIVKSKLVKQGVFAPFPGSPSL